MRLDRIKFIAALARADMTALRLSQITGLSRGTISAVRNGKSCSQKTAAKVAGALGLEVEDLTEVTEE